MQMIIKFILFGMLFLVTLDAQSATPLFNNFDKSKGLDNKYIKAIAEDKYGYIWIGTTSGVYKFNSDTFVKLTVNKELEDIHVSDLFIDLKNNLWIGTKNHGLLLYKNNSVEIIQPKQARIHTITKFTTGYNNRLWVGTSRGIYVLSKDMQLIKPQIKSLIQFSDKNITALTYAKPGTLIIASDGEINAVDVIGDSIKRIDIGTDKLIHDLHLDKDNNLWIANSEQLIKFNLKSFEVVFVPKLLQATRVLSIVESIDDIWVATIGGGIFKINKNSNHIEQYKHQNVKYSLLENNIMVLLISKNEQLWVGNFSQGLSLLDLNIHKLSYESTKFGNYSCAAESKINNIAIDSDNTWLGTDTGLIIYNTVKKTCLNINPSNYVDTYEVYSILLDQNNTWLSTSRGLLNYNQQNNTLLQVTDKNQISRVFFSVKNTDDTLILGADNGLYEYSLQDTLLKKLKVPSPLFDGKPNTIFAKNSKNELLFPTSAGILYLSNSNELKTNNEKFKAIKGSKITSIYFNANDELFIGVLNRGLYHYDSNQQLKQHYIDSELFSPSNYIMQIQSNKTNPNSLWLGTSNGLIQFNIIKNESILFSHNQETKYLSLINSSTAYKNNLIFLGNNGFINFNPNTINTELKKPRLMFSQLYLNRYVVKENIETDSGFILDKSIEDTKTLNFSYKDNMIDLDFIYLNYQSASNTKYYYKLEPVFNQWVELLHGDKRLTFTNLKDGNYKLSLKAMDQVENSGIVELKFKISPAPWFTWWAYACYFIFVFLIIFQRIRHKIKKQEKLNQYLSTQVSKQTQCIQKQKEELEQLIVRKDEIFSNVTHEFKTPITLIKGPIAELLKKETNEENSQTLKMVERNSDKLLRLVNQILQLSQTIESNNNEKKVINLAVRLKFIAEPYLYYAQKKEISFSFDNLEELELLITHDALELTVGNFLSNAFKYTKKGGKIELGTTVQNNSIEIFVKDNGIGFNLKQKEQIFQRFGRIKKHQQIEGSGIGLAIVKEVAELNNAQIGVSSKPGKGSLFSIAFPIMKVNTGSGVSTSSKPDNTFVDQGKATVLIIEDNADMRQHIYNVLKQDFNCILEENGQSGIARALKSVPDIIVSDVMMPLIDGFQVCRTIRNDEITSHIPLILLTALSEKSSRIKGWREGIDLYVNKPFDGEELIFQLKNIIKTRKRLNDKNQNNIKTGNYSEFTEVDGKFIKKLKYIINDNYKDTFFTLQDMASLMFVSERQLQRKTKALLNMPPLDFLREYRFEKASSSLKKGYQVAITSDTCGFSSVSYFSQIFKKRYGMTPKAYQKLKTTNLKNKT